jgi:hypothetical protein
MQGEVHISQLSANVQGGVIALFFGGGIKEVVDAEEKSW